MKSMLFFLFFVSPQILAQEAADKIPAIEPDSSYLLKLTAGLLAVLCIVFLLAWLVKKFQLVPGSNNGLINLVSAISVGQRERIALIQVGEEQILIGLSPGNINKLHVLKNPLPAATQRNITSTSFQQKFNQLLNKEKPDANS